MKRHNRAALAVAALALVLPVSGCASLLSPHQTADYKYNAGDGAWGTVGDVEVRGLMLIMDKSAEGPAQLFFTLVNKGQSAATVKLEVADASANESVAAGKKFVQDPESSESTADKPVVVKDLGAKPGDLVDVDVTSGGETKTIKAQVLSDTLPYYEKYVPTESPSSVPTKDATEDAATEADPGAEADADSADTDSTETTGEADATTDPESSTTTDTGAEADATTSAEG